MAITILNTEYSGEVLEQILTKAALNNEMVNEGLIHVEPGIQKSWALPMLTATRLLQKRVEMPTSANVKGDVNYEEKTLNPVDFMAYTEFNPRTFESIWRPFQPKGNLVFRELNPETQLKLVQALVDKVSEELGENYINGRFSATGLMNGIVSRMLACEGVHFVQGGQTTYAAKLKAVFSAIPKTIRKKPSLKFIMNMDDADAYDYELKENVYKNADLTQAQSLAYNGIPIVSLANWPKGLIVCTLASTGYDGQFYAAVDYNNDEEIFQIDKVSNAGEKYFFKMLMKADTNVAFGDYIVVLDERAAETNYVTEYSGTATSIATNGVLLGATYRYTNSGTSAVTVSTGVESPVEIAGKGAYVFHFNGTSWF